MISPSNIVDDFSCPKNRSIPTMTLLRACGDRLPSAKVDSIPCRTIYLHDSSLTDSVGRPSVVSALNSILDFHQRVSQASAALYRLPRIPSTRPYSEKRFPEFFSVCLVAGRSTPPAGMRPEATTASLTFLRLLTPCRGRGPGLKHSLRTAVEHQISRRI